MRVEKLGTNTVTVKTSPLGGSRLLLLLAAMLPSLLGSAAALPQPVLLTNPMDTCLTPPPTPLMTVALELRTVPLTDGLVARRGVSNGAYLGPAPVACGDVECAAFDNLHVAMGGSCGEGTGCGFNASTTVGTAGCPPAVFCYGMDHAYSGPLVHECGAARVLPGDDWTKLPAVSFEPAVFYGCGSASCYASHGGRYVYNGGHRARGMSYDAVFYGDPAVRPCAAAGLLYLFF